jgi:HEAT repeat protein
MEAKTIEVDPELWLLKDMDFSAPQAMLRTQAEFGSTSVSRQVASLALKNHGDDLLNVATLDRVLNAGGQFWGTRVDAAKSLGNIGSNEACAALRKGLDVDNARARREAASSLSNCRGADVAKSLRRTIAKDPSVGVIGAALRSLGHMREHVHRKTLESGLKRSSWAGIIARGASEGLAEVDADWAFDALIRGAKNRSAHSRARTAAISAISGSADRNPSLIGDALDAAHNLLEESNAFVVRESLRLIAAHGGADDLAALETGIRKIPEKWYHKEIHRWRSKLKKRMKGLESESSSDPDERIEELSETLESLEERLKDLEAKESATAPH